MPDETKTIVVYTAMNWKHACVCIRLLDPLDRDDWRLVKGNADDASAKDVCGADFVIFHREFPGLCSNYGSILWKCRMEQKPVIFEIDDLLSEIPDEHTSSELLKSIAPAVVSAIEDADAVVVSTQRLKDRLVDYNDSISVIHNCLNEELWAMRQPRANPERITIGYAGTVTHGPDAEFIAPALANIADRYGDRVCFSFAGVAPPAVLKGRANVDFHEFDDAYYTDYVRVMNEKTYDIAIAPLIDSEFNRCKSNMKYLEYSAMGAAGVYAMLEPYRSVVSHEENGFLAANLEDWQRYLSLLIENSELRLKVAAAAQQKVRDCFLLGNNRRDIKNEWLSLAEA